MALANVSLDNTFDIWRTRTNQMLKILNDFTEGQSNVTGVLTITNAQNLNGGVSLNVSNGVVRVGPNVFSANAIGVSSNTGQLTVAGSGKLGDRLFLTITPSDRIDDNNAANIASANSLITLGNILAAQDIILADGITGVGTLAQDANTTAMGAFARANAVNTTAIAAFGAANTVNVAAYKGISDAANANAYAAIVYTLANTANNKAYSISLTSLGVNTAISPLLSQTSIGLFKSGLGLGDANTLNVMTPSEWILNTANRLVTTSAAHIAAGVVTLPQVAANIVVDMATFIHGEVNLSNNKLLLNPTNVVPNRSGTIYFKNVSPYNVSFQSNWKPINNLAAPEAGNEMLLTWFSRDSANIFFSWGRAGAY